MTAHSRHVRMRQQRRLDLGPGDVVARGDDHVVGAGGEVEDAVLVLDEIVAGHVPAVAHVGRLTIVGQIAAAGRARARPDGRRVPSGTSFISSSTILAS